jgi:hypothetical protein
MEDIITKDREEFLICEMKFFRFRSLEIFKKYMKDMDVTCEKCQVYYWKGCQKRCKC